MSTRSREGSFPYSQRMHLAMGCNHCLDHSCITGCPTMAYSKDPKTGIVHHKADASIGCEYCIWNCLYSVPTLNRKGHVVGKCDMGHGRLAEGDARACVDACSSDALSIAIVDFDKWRQEYRDETNAPGLPSADDTISTTRVTVPAKLRLDSEKADLHRTLRSKPHYSLVLMTVLTHLPVAGFVAMGS